MSTRDATSQPHTAPLDTQFVPAVTVQGLDDVTESGSPDATFSLVQWADMLTCSFNQRSHLKTCSASLSPYMVVSGTEAPPLS